MMIANYDESMKLAKDLFYILRKLNSVIMSNFLLKT
jgi:hypothetical protein